MAFSQEAYELYLANAERRQNPPILPTIAETMEANGWLVPPHSLAIGRLSVGNKVIVAYVNDDGGVISATAGEVAKVLPRQPDSIADYAHIQTANSLQIVSNLQYPEGYQQTAEFLVFPHIPADR